MGFRIFGIGFEVWGLELSELGFVFRIIGIGLGVWGSGFIELGLRFGV